MRPFLKKTVIWLALLALCTLLGSSSALAFSVKYSTDATIKVATVNSAVAASQALVWADTDQDSIYRADLDGSNPQVLVDMGAMPAGTSGSTSFSPRDVLVAGSFIYWTDSTQDSIYRANLDGTNPEVLIDKAAIPTNAAGSTSYTPVGIAADGSFIYWADGAQDSIYRANLDGSNPIVLIDETAIPASSMGSSTSYGQQGLTVDATFIYWADSTQDSIYRANLDGSNPEVLIDETVIPFSSASSTSYSQQGIAVDATFAYWVDSGQDSIYRANLDGSSPQVLVDKGIIPASTAGSTSYVPDGVTVDGTFVYWSDRSQASIYRANLDGSSPQVLIDVGTLPLSTAGSTSFQPRHITVGNFPDVGGGTTEVTLDTGVLTITDSDGGDSNDALTISYTGGNYTITDAGGLLLTTAIAGASGDGTDTLTIPDTGVTGIKFDTLGGADSVTVTSIQAALTGAFTIEAGDGTDSATINTSAINAASITLNDSVTLSQSTTLTADEIDFGGGANSVNGTVDLTLAPATTSATIGVGGGTGTLDISDTDIAALTDGFTSITIGDTTNGTGTVDIDSATFLDPVTIAGGTIKDNAGTDITAPSVTFDGNVAPGQSPGQLLVSGDLSFTSDGALTLEIDGTAGAGVAGGHDQVAVTGAVELNNAVLTGTLGFTPPDGTNFIIIDNDGTDAVTGTFNGLAEGAMITIGDYEFTITYLGIDGMTGNDVVLLDATPLAVTLALFETEADSDSILIRWQTVSERDNLGFNLYRATESDGEPSQLNSDLISAQAPGSGQGAEYEWLDTTVETGSTYFYWLSDVDVNGNTTMHGPISATANQTTAVTTTQLSTQSHSELPALALLMLTLFVGGWLLRRRR